MENKKETFSLTWKHEHVQRVQRNEEVCEQWNKLLAYSISDQNQERNNKWKTNKENMKTWEVAWRTCFSFYFFISDQNQERKWKTKKRKRKYGTMNMFEKSKEMSKRVQIWEICVSCFPFLIRMNKKTENTQEDKCILGMNTWTGFISAKKWTSAWRIGREYKNLKTRKGNTY